MPELPEVEAARRLVERHCKGAKIAKAVVADDEKVIEGIEPKELEKALQGQLLTAPHRLGKHLWLELNANAPCLMFHFGMTGSMRIEGVDSPQYQTFTVDESQWPPRFWKVQLEFEGGVKLAFCDARRFARVRLQADPMNNEPLNKLGFDLLLSMPSLDDFTTALEKQRRSVKALIMDQSFSAGVGNWVADEVLYQSRIHPEQPANSLDAQQAQRLHQFMQSVPQTAVDAGADSAKLPPEWLFHRKWDQKNAPTIDGHSISFIKVGGRTTAFVPDLQKLPAGQSSTTASKPRKRKADVDAEGSAPAGSKAAPKPRSKAASKGKQEAESTEAGNEEDVLGEADEAKAPSKKDKVSKAAAGKQPARPKAQAVPKGSTKRKKQASATGGSNNDPANEQGEGKAKDASASKRAAQQATPKAPQPEAKTSEPAKGKAKGSAKAPAEAKTKARKAKSQT